MIAEKYPYTDFNEYNLDWIICKVKDILTYFEGTNQLATISYVDEQIAEAKNDIQISLDHLQALIDDLEDTKLDRTDFDTFVSEVSLSLNSMGSAITVLERLTAENAQAIIDTYNELKDYIDSQLIDLEVINPLTGNIQPIQLVLNYMANFLRTDSLTAQEYDDAELTAKAYDDLELTAFNYDNYGKNYIGI